MSASNEEIKKLAQAYLRNRGFYSGDIDGLWGDLSNKAFARYADHLAQRGLEVGGEEQIVEDAASGAISGVIVIDPGHGGSGKIGGSSGNNATSASGVLEKTMTLDLARRVETQLQDLANAMPGSRIDVHLTRSGDVNLSLSDRAQLAESTKADIFLSIHFNGFNGRARGTETLIISTANGNVNEQEDRELAQRVQSAMLAAIRRFDPDARDRGVKNGQKLGVLNDISLGNTRIPNKTRACLVEVEFIDSPPVDELLNTGPNAQAARDAIARAIAEALVDDLRVRR